MKQEILTLNYNQICKIAEEFDKQKYNLEPSDKKINKIMLKIEEQYCKYALKKELINGYIKKFYPEFKMQFSLEEIKYLETTLNINLISECKIKKIKLK